MAYRRPIVRASLAAGMLTLSALVGGPVEWGRAIAAQPGRRLQPPPPAWRYPVDQAHDASSALNPKGLRSVAGSQLQFTNEQVDDLFIAPDWHPQEYSPAPAIVSQGRRPATYACGYCHRITGAGAPENAHLAGLPWAYIKQQLEDFRRGGSRSSRPERVPQALMTVTAASLTDDEIDAAAHHFAEQHRTTTFRVLEARMAPGAHSENWVLAADRPAREVPLGQHLLELPDDPQDVISRNTRARFTI